MPQDHYIRDPPFLISFDWADQLTNTGYKTYYCVKSLLLGAHSYDLVTSSAMDANYAPYVTTAATEYKFALTFKKVVTVRGRAYVNFTIDVSGSNLTSAVTVKVYHWDGASETEIGSATGSYTSSGAGNGFHRGLFAIDIAATKFQVEETIRVGIEVNANLTALYFDPSTNLTYTENGTTRTIGSDMTIDVPFKLVE